MISNRIVVRWVVLWSFWIHNSHAQDGQIDGGGVLLESLSKL